jgi:hypothetical protein
MERRKYGRRYMGREVKVRTVMNNNTIERTGNNYKGQADKPSEKAVRRIVGEALAIMYGLHCWRLGRPLRYCPECDCWWPRLLALGFVQHDHVFDARAGEFVESNGGCDASKP